MYVYVLCMYVEAYEYLCERWVWARMWLRRLACTRACDCAHNMYVYIYIYIYMYIRIYMYIYIYVCICFMYVCIGI